MRYVAAAFLFVLANATACAAEFVSLREAAVLYDAPSRQGEKRLIYGPGYPVTVVVRLSGWVKVKDPAGELGWLESKVLGDPHTVIVTAPLAQVRERPAADAPLIFEAERNVLLDLVEAPQSGWAKVQHRDGATGYVNAVQIWGV